jgi:hypothetical protein
VTSAGSDGIDHLNFGCADWERFVDEVDGDEHQPKALGDDGLELLIPADAIRSVDENGVPARRASRVMGRPLAPLARMLPLDP